MNLTFLNTTLLFFCFTITTTSSPTNKLTRGFTASPPSTSAFHALLTDPTSTFSFGFLPSPPSLLRLAVLHLPSSTPLWLSPASTTWHPSTTLLFNDSLLLLDPPSAFHITPPGDLLLLLPTSNLQLTTSTSTTVLWQSFDHPSHTIVQNQNFTSNSTLSSPNHRFYMSLGRDFIGLYMNYSSQVQPPLYFKETALQIRAPIAPGKGPLYARVNATGYLGLYQGEASLVHLVPFATYQRSIETFWRLTMENDGNLRGYYWNGTSWVVGYQAVKEFCKLPSGCGAYGLCVQEGTAGRCKCLDRETSYEEGVGCAPRETGSLCGEEEGGGGGGGEEYRVVVRTGVALAYKEYLGYTTVASMEECEGRCERNCSCWGVIYGNATGACYVMDFPVETVVEDGGEGRVGYFKVRKKRREVEGKGWAMKLSVGLVVVGLAVGGLGVWGVLTRRRRNGVEGSAADGVDPVPYKGLRASPSFRAVEMSMAPKQLQG